MLKIILFFDKENSECRKLKEILDENKTDYTLIPCRGLAEPEIIIDKNRYSSLTNEIYKN
jgi:hypothetical protein